MKKAILILTLTLSIATLFSGCGKKAVELSDYEKSIQSFTDNVVRCGNEIDAIDVNSENASQQMLAKLDEMEGYFQSIVGLDAPEKYDTNENLADVAAQYMSQANLLYHQSFESEVFDDALFQSATYQYNEAMKYASYIGSVLMDVDPTAAENEDVSEE